MFVQTTSTEELRTFTAFEHVNKNYEELQIYNK